MSYKYNVKRKINNINPQEEGKFFAVPVLNRQITTEEAAKEIEEASTLTQSDVLAAISALSHLIERKVMAGYSVKLDGLGIFSLSLTSDGFTDPKKCTPSKVKPKKICFRSDSKLKKAISYTKFERDTNE